MAHRLVWTTRALDNLDGLSAYIARDSPANASRVVRKLFAASDSLKRFPRMGRVVPEDIYGRRRELIVRPYRLIYEIDDATSTVSITRIIHGSRDLTELLRIEPD